MTLCINSAKQVRWSGRTWVLGQGRSRTDASRRSFPETWGNLVSRAFKTTFKLQRKANLLLSAQQKMVQQQENEGGLTKHQKKPKTFWWFFFKKKHTHTHTCTEEEPDAWFVSKSAAPDKRVKKGGSSAVKRLQ